MRSEYSGHQSTGGSFRQATGDRPGKSLAYCKLVPIVWPSEAIETVLHSRAGPSSFQEMMTRAMGFSRTVELSRAVYPWQKMCSPWLTRLALAVRAPHFLPISHKRPGKKTQVFG